MRNSLAFILSTAFLCLISQSYLKPASAFAEDNKAKPINPALQESKELKGGVIASYGSVTKSGSVDSAYNPSTSSKKEAPVSASINQLGRDRCEVVVKNGSGEDAVSTRFKVIGTRSNGATAFTKHYSARIGAGESISRSVSCPKDVSIDVVLKSGKVL